MKNKHIWLIVIIGFLFAYGLILVAFHYEFKIAWNDPRLYKSAFLAFLFSGMVLVLVGHPRGRGPGIIKF